MNLTKCPNGHFYDSDKYSKCPHCGNGGGLEDNDTVSIGKAMAEDDVTVSVGMVGVQNKSNFVSKVSPMALADDDDEKTVSYFDVSREEGKLAVEPCVGWLVCIKGSLRGTDFHLKSGRNFIGRDSSMDICLNGDNKVSRSKHAVIIYDPKMNTFLAQPGESKELFYLNGDLVVNAISIKYGDMLEIGDSVLLFVPLCGEAFNWNEEF